MTGGENVTASAGSGRRPGEAVNEQRAGIAGRCTKGAPQSPESCQAEVCARVSIAGRCTKRARRSERGHRCR